jgi:xanthine dehydrogenase accessory factor
VIAEWARILEGLEDQGRVARVSVVATRGSTPREVGASMVVRRDLGFRGTIGGGALEWRALRLAWDALGTRDAAFALHDVLLGPDLGQCCGGRVTLGVEVFDTTDLPAVRELARAEAAGLFATEARAGDGRPIRRILATAPDTAPGAVGLLADGRLIERFGDDRRAVLLFGAGHIGRALVVALAPLPFRVAWIDGRSDAFPDAVPATAEIHRLDDPVAALGRAPAGALVMIATHDHALDLALVDAALRRDDLPLIGVVGSKTKRARFSSKLREIGHTDPAIRRMVMPVGTVGPRSKSPSVIAAAIAVELLLVDEAVREGRAVSTSAEQVSGVQA